MIYRQINRKDIRKVIGVSTTSQPQEGDKDVGFVWNKKHRYRGALGLKRPSVQDNTDKLTLLLF